MDTPIIYNVSEVAVLAPTYNVIQIGGLMSEIATLAPTYNIMLLDT